MGHGLTEVDHLAYVGVRPWHGFGTELKQMATAEEMITAAHLGFLVDKQRIFIADGIDPAGNPRYKALESHVATVRTDTNDVLGVVTNDYTVLQNIEAFRFLDAVTMDPNGPKYETAGSLHRGRTVWALAKVPKMIEVGGVDPVTNYLFAKTSHDGGGAFTVAWTPIRIVCQNTLSMAEDRMLMPFRWHHVGRLLDRVAQAREMLGIISQKQDDTLKLFNAMFKTQVTGKEANRLLEGFLQRPQKVGVEMTHDQRCRRMEIQRDIMARFNGGGIGLGEKKLQGSAWTLLNAFDEWADRKVVVRCNGGIAQEEARFRSSFVGNAQKGKSLFMGHLQKELAISGN